MGAVKKIPKDWRTQSTSGTKAGLRTRARFDSLEVTKSEDLPELMNSKEAALLLRCHYKTVEEYRRDGTLKFVRIKNRWFTTPEFIAEYLENESSK